MNQEQASFFGAKIGTPYMLHLGNICLHTCLMTVRFHTMAQSDCWRNFLLGPTPGVMVLPSQEVTSCIEFACCAAKMTKKVGIYLEKPVATVKGTVSRIPCQMVSDMVDRAKIQLALPVYESFDSNFSY